MEEVVPTKPKRPRAARVTPEMFANPIFGSRPLTHREAYVWLCIHSPVQLSRRQLAKIWHWQSSTVDRLLKKLIAHGLIQSTAVAGRSVPTITAVQWRTVTPRFEIAADSWAELRQQVFKRDGFKCVYCGGTEQLSCDHSTPITRGGLTIISNLVTACKACNSSKGKLTPVEWRGAHG
jgi:predicted transcriptional regulator